MAEPEKPSAAGPVSTQADQPEQVPEAAKETAVETLSWPAVKADSPLQKIIDKAPELVKEAEYAEVFGLQLDGPSTFHRNMILQKFLRANANDVDKAATQLLETLKWRKSFEPLKARDETFSAQRFGGLGYVSVVSDVPESPNKTDVVGWNIYGAVKDNQATFGDLDGFARWRVGLMELSLAKLNLAGATEPIPNYGEGPDPYQCMQVHDYMNVSFLRQDPHSKAAAKKAIDLFGHYYPETLSRKFFVNVPTIMGWMFSAMKLVLSKETVRKFTVLTYGKDLAGELGSSLPDAYGGKAGSLEDAEQLKLAE